MHLAPLLAQERDERRAHREPPVPHFAQHAHRNGLRANLLPLRVDAVRRPVRRPGLVEDHDLDLDDQRDAPLLRDV
eukprot:4585829-Pleurochrysis_carterae.AAC.1